jgi:FlaG/FlaF family flagellin (archaellin)
MVSVCVVLAAAIAVVAFGRPLRGSTDDAVDTGELDLTLAAAD